MTLRYAIVALFSALVALVNLTPLAAQYFTPATVQTPSVSQRLAFVEHAAFFSLETKQPALVDPQAFVAAPSAAAVTGLQGIAHAAGVRNAQMVDDAALPVLSGAGKPLGFTLGQWFAASGTLELTPIGRGVQITMHFAHLVPSGRYSLFENHFDVQPVAYTPLDGAGVANGFVASEDGTANVTVTAPAPLTHDNAVLLVYHSDGIDHGAQRGAIGILAHHQLVARIP